MAKQNEGKVFEAPYTKGIPGMPDSQGKVLIGLACGGCGHEWKDHLYANKESRVTCPNCGGINTFTLNISYY